MLRAASDGERSKKPRMAAPRSIVNPKFTLRKARTIITAKESTNPRRGFTETPSP